MKKTPDYNDKKVLCPFYILEDRFRLRCEGYCEGTWIQLRFRDSDIKKEHKRKYCKDINGYKQCPLHPVIMVQYGGVTDYE